MLRKQLAMVVIAGMCAMSAVNGHCPDLKQKRKELGWAERYLNDSKNEKAERERPGHSRRRGPIPYIKNDKERRGHCLNYSTNYSK